MVSAIHDSVGSKEHEVSEVPIFCRSDADTPSLTRPMVRCGLKLRLSLANPCSAIASSTPNWTPVKGAMSPATPAHKTLGWRWFGNTPNQARVKERLDTS